MSDDEINVTLDDFRSQVASGGAIDRRALHFPAEHALDPSQRIFVFFAEEKSVGVKTMGMFLQQLEAQGIGRGIIIFQEKMTSSAHKVIDAMRSQFELEEFAEGAMLVNITHHHLVPKHEVLSDEDKKALLQR